MKSKIILFVILIFLVAKPMSLKSQSTIFGYSNIFSLGTPMYDHPKTIGYSNIFTLGAPMYDHQKFIGYSGVFEMNLMGQYFSGYSGLFSLNTIGGIIKGQITDSQTGQPVQGTIVKTLSYTSPPSNAQGMYELHVPFGYGYVVSAVMPNYQSVTINNVHVPVINPVKVINFQLLPGVAEVAITSLLLNPNPQISEVQQGGQFHRYYRITNLSGSWPYPPISVTVSAGGFTKSYQSDGNGIIDISINSYQIGNGLPGTQATFAITSVNNQPLADPIEFVGKVINQEYSKTWDSYTTTKLGVSHFSVEVEGGLYSSLNVNGGTTPSSYFINRQLRAGGGVSAGVGAGLSVQMGNIVNGAYAGAGVGAVISGITEDNYQFSHINYNNWDAMAQYILIADGSFGILDNTMIRLLTAIQNVFTNQNSLNEAYQSDKKCIDIKGDATADAQVGLLFTPYVNLNANANIGATSRVQFDFQRDFVQDEIVIGVEKSGLMSTGAGAGIKFILPPNQEWTQEMPNLYTVFNAEERRGLRFEVKIDPSNLTVKGFKMTFLKRSITNKSGFEEERSYYFTGQDVTAVISYINSTVQNLVGAVQNNSSYTIDNTSFQELTVKIFTQIINNQGNIGWDADISYEVTKRNIDNISSFPINIFVGLEALIKVSASYGADIGFEEGRERMVERGKWILGKHYPLETFSSNLPNVNVTFQSKMQEITDAVPLSVRTTLGLINFISRLFKSDNDTYLLGDNGSYIVIPPQAFPTELDSISVTSWGWYGDSPSKKQKNLESSERKLFDEYKRRAEKSFGMQYGVGGFYQFEPYSKLFNDTCYITIYYSDEEIEGIDELSLGLYYEDKENRKWVYIGGIVDTISNNVTAPVNRLALYTLAPAMPFGTFGLNAMPDSIIADSISVSTIISDTIFNNNFTPVSNGEMFTVNATLGRIITTDSDPLLPGIQVMANNHKIEFEVRSNVLGGKASVTALSVNGSANGLTEILFYDTVPPVKPVISVITTGNSSVELIWLKNFENDLAGYFIYYDTDTIPPFNGIHTVYGQPSPISLGLDTTRNIIGLFNDTTYYFSVSAFDLSGNESALSAFVSATPFVTINQTLNIPIGWSGLSSSISPIPISVESLFSPILSDLIILQSETGMYWPGENTNTIGNWDTHQGYKIKVADAVELTIAGTRENNKTLALSAGWNLIPVLSECAVDMEALFAGKDLVIVKEVAGWNLYWPEYGINTLGVLLPGKAYFVLMGSEGEIEFPECDELKNVVVPTLTGFQTLSGLTPWLTTNPTSSTHTIALLFDSGAEDLQSGDIIGAFDAEGNCSGLVVWQNEATAITLFGNDLTTATIDGFDEGEPLQFKLYCPETSEEFTLDVTFDSSMPNPDPVFATHGLSAISELKVSSLGISSEGTLPKVSIIPNPANDEFRLVIEGKDFEVGTLKIFAMDGRIAKTVSLNDRNSLINISELRSGIYMLEIEFGANTLTRRLVKY